MSFLQDKHRRYTASLRADLARRGFTDGVQELLGKKISVIFIYFMCLLISCGYVVMKKIYVNALNFRSGSNILTLDSQPRGNTGKS